MAVAVCPGLNDGDRSLGSLMTRRWRKPDSNHRSRGRPPPSSWYRLSSRRLLRCGKQSRHEPLSRNLGRLTRYWRFDPACSSGESDELWGLRSWLRNLPPPIRTPCRQMEVTKN